MATTVAEIEALIVDCTGEFVVAPEWNAFMRICDTINANPTKVKLILTPLVKRLQTSKDANSLLLSLELLDAVVKNCAASYAYVGSSEVQATLMKIATTKKISDRVLGKVLHMVQQWSFAFEKFDPQRYLFKQTFFALANKGFKFPPPEVVQPYAVPTSIMFVGDSDANKSPRSISQVPVAIAPARASEVAVKPRVVVSKHHDIVPDAAMLKDAEIVAAATNAASLLAELLSSVPSRPLPNEDPKRENVLLHEVAAQCIEYQKNKLPEIVARVLDRQARVAGTVGAVSEQAERDVRDAFAAVDAVDESIASYKRWKAVDETVRIEIADPVRLDAVDLNKPRAKESIDQWWGQPSAGVLQLPVASVVAAPPSSIGDGWWGKAKGVDDDNSDSDDVDTAVPRRAVSSVATTSASSAASTASSAASPAASAASSSAATSKSTSAYAPLAFDDFFAERSKLFVEKPTTATTLTSTTATPTTTTLSSTQATTKPTKAPSGNLIDFD